MSTASGEPNKGPQNSEKQNQDSPSGAASHRIRKKDKGMCTDWLISFTVYLLCVIHCSSICRTMQVADTCVHS